MTTITLPPLLYSRSGKYSEASVRARDLEVAKCVLEAAAQAAGPEYSYVDLWFKAKADAAQRIRNLEVKHE